jgi:hypothetical protein
MDKADAINEPASDSSPITVDTGGRPNRTRRPPTRFSPYVMTLIMMLQLGTLTTPLQTSTTTDGLIFIRGPLTAFSESSWVLVTEFSTLTVQKQLDELGPWLDQPTAPHIKFSTPFDELLRQKIERAINDISHRTRRARDELSTIHKVTGSPTRTRRAIMEGGGQLMKWLFGTATNKDLHKINQEVDKIGKQQKEITHVLAQQATLVNESLWETHTMLTLVEKQTQDTRKLNLSINSLTTKLDYLVTQVEQRWATWEEVERRLDC